MSPNQTSGSSESAERGHTCPNCERLRAALKECADDLAAEIEARYPVSNVDTPGRDVYPDMKRRYDRDMAPVVAVRKLLGNEQSPNIVDYCSDCGAEIAEGDVHGCPGRPGENKW